MKPSSIVILTGAGISAESGVDTFRDKDGIWSKYDLNDVATPEGFARNPAMVHDFYNQRRASLAGVKPNPAHGALARLEREFDGEFLLVTQNIDDLHERAGSRKLIHMHGELTRAFCANCNIRCDAGDTLSVEMACTHCGSKGFMRPDVVWFGEMPYQMERIYTALNACDLFVSIGTSGQVYPAAGFALEAGRVGARTLELNLEATGPFDDRRLGPATEVVPAWVEEVLAAT